MNYNSFYRLLQTIVCTLCLLIIHQHSLLGQAFDPEFANIGIIYGRITNALNGTPITNATMTFAGKTIRSDAAGYYVLRDVPTTLSSDFYTTKQFGAPPLYSSFLILPRNGAIEILTVTSANFSSYRNEQISVRPQERTELNISLNPEIRTSTIGVYRIVLTWKQLPYDLDAYTLTPRINDTTWRVGFTLRGSLQKTPFVNLDYDVRDGFGPETITIRRLFPGTYKYSINNVSADVVPSVKPLGGCGAAVEIYSDTGLVQRFVVPEVGVRRQNWWHVFTIDGATGRITPINVLDSTDIEKFRWNTALAQTQQEQAQSFKKNDTRTNADEPFRVQWQYGNGSSDTKSGTSFASFPLLGSTLYTTSGTFTVRMTLTAANGFTYTLQKPEYISTLGAVTDARYGQFSTGDLVGIPNNSDETSAERSLLNALQTYSVASVGIWREPIKGIVADTASRLAIIAAAPDTLTPMTITLEGAGSLSPLNRLREQSKQLQVRPRMIVGQREINAGVYYTPPATLNLPPGVSETTITIRISGGTLGTLAIPLRLVRPPVVLVHDAWSDASAWERGGFASYLRQIGYTVFTANYGSNSVGHFNTQSNMLPSLGISAVTTAIAQARSFLREQGIVVQRVDVVAHGLGGLMTRALLQSEERIFANYAGSVRRFITLGTPHNGTPLGGLLWSRRNISITPTLRYSDIFSIMGFPIGEAHRALSGADNDNALQNLGSLAVQSHAIVANWRPDAKPAAETMNTLLKILQSPNEYRVGAALYDTLFGNQDHDLIADMSSQRGGLSGKAVTEYSSMAHSDLPFAGQSQTLITSSVVMRRVNELLRSSSAEDFAPTLPASAPPSSPVRSVTNTPSVPRGGIRIIQPGNGFVVPVNSSLPIQVRVEPTGNGALRDIVFVVEGVGIGLIPSIGTPPYSAAFTLPSRQEISTGRVRLIVLAREVETGILVADTTSLFIQTQGIARDMVVSPGALQLVAGTPLGISQLQVTSLFTDNSTQDVTKSAQGTSYTSLTGRVTVSQDGVITGFGSITNPISFDTVLVKNGSITLRVPVRIFGALLPTGIYDNKGVQNISQQKEQDIFVRPNPASSETSLSYFLTSPAKIRINIIDMLGRQVLSLPEVSQQAGQNTQLISTSALAPGHYVIQIQKILGNYSSQETTTRLIIIR